MTSSATRLGLFALLAGLIAACSGGCGSDDAMTDSAIDEGDSDLSKSCPADTPEFNYGPSGLTSEPNMELGIKAYLDTASSRPPFKGANDWTIAITDLNGVAMPDANLTWACAFMPTHGHGSNPKMVNKLGDGKFQLVRQNLAMEGGWEIQLWVDPTGGGTPYTGGSSALDPNACRGPGTKLSLVLKACVPG